MTQGQRKRFGVLLGAVAVLVTACGSPGAPVDPAPVESGQRPMPANAKVERDVAGAGGSDTSCNPEASVQPNGSVPSGSTMDEIKQRGYLTVGVDQNTFLFGFRNPTTGQLEGFDIDIAKQIAQSLLGDANAVRFKAITSAQREKVLADGDVDLVVRTYSITCERKQDINFSTVYYKAGQRVLVKNNSKANGLQDLGGKRVCAAKESTSLQNIARVNPRTVPVSVDDWTDCLVMLQQGQVDAVSTDDTILAGMQEQDPTTKVIGDQFTEELYGVGIPKGNDDMVSYVNAVLEQIRGSSWQASYDHWVKDNLGPAKPPAPKYE